MPLKKYAIAFDIQDVLAQAAIRRSITGLVGVERGAYKAGAAMVQSYTSAGVAAGASAQTQISAGNRVATAHLATIRQRIGDLKRLHETRESLEAMARSSLSKSERASAQKADKDLELLGRTYLRQVRNAAAAEKAAQRRAAQEQEAQTKAVAAEAKAAKAKRATGAAGVQAADDEAKAREKTVLKSMVGLDRLRMAGIKLKDALIGSAQTTADKTAAAEKKKADEVDAIESRFVAKDYRRRVAHQAQLAKLNRKLLTDEQVSAQVRNALVDKTNQKRIDAAMQAAGVERGGFAGLEHALTRVGTAALGLNLAQRAVQTFVSAFAEAKKSSAEMARQVLDTVAALRDIAAIKERFGPDEAELNQHMAVRLASGLTHTEAHDFQEELYNALGTISKDKFSDTERAKLEVSGAQYAARAGGGPGAVKARATVLGLLPDYLKGKPSAERVVDEADRVDVILGKGAGSQQVSTTQYQELLTALTSEDLSGFLHDPKQAAALNAIASKFGPNHAATSVLQAVREVRGLTKFRKGVGIDTTQAETLEKAGISEHDDPVAAMRKLFKYADANFGDEAFHVALGRRGFRNQEGNERLAQFYEQYRKGNFDQIMGLAEQATPEGMAAEKNTAFQKTDTFRDLKGKALIDQAKITQGKKAVDLLIAKQEAEAELIDEGIDRPSGKLAATIAGLGTLGTVEGRDILIEQRAVQNSRQRAGLPAETTTDMFGKALGFVPGGELLSLAMPSLQHLFGNREEEVRQLKRIADSNEAMAKREGARQAPAALPAAPAAGPGRP